MAVTERATSIHDPPGGRVLKRSGGIVPFAVRSLFATPIRGASRPAAPALHDACSARGWSRSSEPPRWTRSRRPALRRSSSERSGRRMSGSLARLKHLPRARPLDSGCGRSTDEVDQQITADDRIGDGQRPAPAANRRHRGDPRPQPRRRRGQCPNRTSEHASSLRLPRQPRHVGQLCQLGPACSGTGRDPAASGLRLPCE